MQVSITDSKFVSKGFILLKIFEFIKKDYFLRNVFICTNILYMASETVLCNNEANIVGSICLDPL